MKDHVNVLLLGDDGVGKSSLLSAYISHHFPQEVPPIVIDAEIPRDMVWSNVSATFMDSSSRASERENLKEKIRMADSIIAMYDVTRPETFENLVREWLPLVREINDEEVHEGPIKNKPVIVLGNKLDLLVDEEDPDRILDLLDDFPFVFLGLQCSAAQLLKIDDAFYYGVLVVTFPIEPIFDITQHGEFTPLCRRALLRAFRIFDIDCDNLLNDTELTQFHSRCFGAEPLSVTDILNMKRQLSNVVGGLQNNFVTFEGLLTLIKNALKLHQLEFPWVVLSECNYDDNLELMIPPEVSTHPNLKPDQVPELSNGALHFLTGLARNAYSENARPIRSDSDSNSDVEDCLTSEALKSILSVLSSDDDHPWIAPPAFKSPWPYNNNHNGSSTNSPNANNSEEIQQSVLLPGLPHINANLSFDRWIVHWQLLALSDPVLTQVLLFKLGYAERGDYGIIPSSGVAFDLVPKFARRRSKFAVLHRQLVSTLLGSGNAKSSAGSSSSAVSSSNATVSDLHPKQIARVCILGDNNVGKSSFVWHVSGLTPPGSASSENIVERGVEYEKPIETIVIGGCPQSVVVQPSGHDTENEIVEHLTSPSYLLSLTAIPLEHMKKWCAKSLSSCDVVILMFQCGDAQSLHLAFELEQMLPSKLPRVFIGTKVDLFTPKSSSSVNLLNQMHVESLEMHERVIQEVMLHVQEHDLPNVILISTQDDIAIIDSLQTIHTVLQSPMIAIPSKQRPRPLKFYQQPTIMVVSAATLSVAAVMMVFYNYKEVKDWFSSLLKTSRSWFVGGTA